MERAALEIVGSEIRPAASQELREIYRGKRYVVHRTRNRDIASVVIKSVLVREGAHVDRAGLNAAADRLRRECELISELDVSGISRALAFDQGSLVLEDAGPMNLKESVRRRPLGLDLFFRLAIQLAEIVGRIHDRKVIHRDITPANVVVAPGWRLTLVDFDAAMTVSDLARENGAPTDMDVELPYIAPEQTGRMQHTVDLRADLYSLGATYYELLTGAPPFASQDPISLIHAHLARAPLSPSTVRRDVPTTVSNIVLRLLAKMPEARYQSAEALRADLMEAQRQLEATGTIPAFELGLLDLTRELPLPEKLYGREHELAVLRGAFERVRGGASEVVLVTGPAGVGKSALALELREFVARARGAFGWGKLDLRKGNMPYAPIVDAFRGLVLEILDEPESVVATWRKRIREALGRIGGAITSVIPELEKLIGPCQPVPRLGPLETENRFYLVVQSLVRALATRDRPLVLFIDDLQWADSATSKLFRVLATASDLPFVLLLGAFRHEEVDARHPLSRTLDALRIATTPVRMLELPLLDAESLASLCADALSCDRERAMPLAELLRRKTAGNPLFVRSLLRYLQKAQFLAFDTARGQWVWDESRIASVRVSDNVPELLVKALRGLPQPTRDALTVAACIGNRFGVELLAAAQGRTVETMIETLAPAVREDLVGPLSDGSYRFAHDRIQQAAYSLLTEDDKEQCHLRIGVRLLARGDGMERDERIFEIVDQLDHGAPLLVDPNERVRLAELNLRAARKARTSSAYGAGLEYLQIAMDLLPDDAWESRHAITFDVHREAVEGAAFIGNDSLRDGYFAAAWNHSTSVLDRAELCNIRIIAATVKGDLDDAIQWGERGLALFGARLPRSGDSPEARAEVEAVRKNLRGRAIADLIEAPQMADPSHLAYVQLLASLVPPVYLGRPELFPFVISRLANLSLLHGNTVHSAFGFAGYGVIAWREEDFASAHAFRRLAIALGQRFADPVQQSMIMGVVATLLDPWRVPLRSCVTELREAMMGALEAGDFQFANYWSTYSVLYLFAQGVEFAQVLAEVERALAMASRTYVPTVKQRLLLVRQTIRCLQGLTLGRNRLDDSEFDEEAFVARNRNDGFATSLYEILRLEMAYLYRDFRRALEMASAFGDHALAIPANPMLAEDNFFTSLTLAAACDLAAPEERDALLGRIADNQRRLDAWAANCSANFEHKRLLVAAEVARVEGRPIEAMSLYEEAIDCAVHERFLRDEAIAKELAGRFHHSLGNKRIALHYLSMAREAYARWGASGKVDALDEEFFMLAPIEPATDTAAASVDFLGVLKASETITGEVVVERLLEKLMDVSLTMAGAERGVLAIEEGGRLLVRAMGSIGEPVSLVPILLETSAHVPRSVLEHVCATGEIVVQGDASQGTFASDPYVVEHRLKSVLALPLRRGTKLSGVLYLENKLASHVFTAARVRVLSLLSAQMAISLENSLLFDRLKHEIDERSRVEAALRFLADTGVLLSTTLDSEATLAKVARLAVPFLADGCLIDVERDGALERVATAHADPEKERVLLELQGKRGIQAGARHVVRTREPLLFGEVTDETLARYNDPEVLPLVRKLDVRSALVVPLHFGGRTLGAMSLLSSTKGRRYGPADVAFVEEIARRAAGAIENARLYEEAQSAIRSRDEFLSIASHELKTPITSLQLLVQALKGGVVASSPEALTKSFQVAERQTRRLTKLIEGLLDVSRAATGQRRFQLEQVDLAAVVRDTADGFREDLARASCELRLQAPKPIIGYWERSRLEQVVANLLSNAIKFGAGKPIEMTTEERNGTAVLVVRDQGIGIPPEQLQRIFGRFQRAVSAKQYGGLGLGLYISRDIVRAFGGTIRAESTVGVGSAFAVELPCAGPEGGGTA